jgi:hypothetical protein
MFGARGKAASAIANTAAGLDRMQCELEDRSGRREGARP